jgi:hypothetical protein
MIDLETEEACRLSTRSTTGQKKENVWCESCCLRVNKNAMVFFAQLAISLIVMGFSIFMLSKSDSCEHDSLYSGLLSMIIGVWVRAPSISKS